MRLPKRLFCFLICTSMPRPVPRSVFSSFLLHCPLHRLYVFQTSQIEVLMPLPKLPTKPAALLSPQDYPKADKDKIVKSLTLIEPAMRKIEPAPAVTRARIADRTPVGKPNAVSTPAVALAPKANARRPVAKVTGPTQAVRARHQRPDARSDGLFRFEEHDIYLPMITLEELDNNKKGMTEVARNARQVAASSTSWSPASTDNEIDEGIPLAKLGNRTRRAACSCRPSCMNAVLPAGLPTARPTTRSSASSRSAKRSIRSATWCWCRRTSTCASRRARWACRRGLLQRQGARGHRAAVLRHAAAAGRLLGQARQGHGIVADRGRPHLSTASPVRSCRRCWSTSSSIIEPKTARRRSTRQVKEITGKTARAARR